jgi:hypothetical protein
LKARLEPGDQTRETRGAVALSAINKPSPMQANEARASQKVTAAADLHHDNRAAG